MAGLAGSSVDSALRPRLVITALIFFINAAFAEEILLTVNVKKPLALTSDSFLSYTLDPTTVLTGNALTENPERILNLAKALSPAYVRIGGPRSNSYTFVRSHNSPSEEDPNFTITEKNWISLHRWAENAGLKVLACIAPQQTEIGDGDFVWDSRNALDLISFSDHMGFNTSWQLGYECQTRCDISGDDMGKAVQQLRGILNAFPRYSKSIVTGPDAVTYRTKQQQQYLQDYLNAGGNSLSAITWHPTLAGISFDVEGVSMHNDNLVTEKDALYKVIGRSMWKKPLWLAESRREKCKDQFLGALVWTRRLGIAAKLGIQVIMRQPEVSKFFQPTPDYWVSVLHKNLVGREVLDVKINTGNRSHVYFYCQCTRPSSKYEKGSLTIFGINLTAKKILVNLKSLKITSVHKYILMPGMDAENRMFSETVLLNNEPLSLVNDRQLPEIKPIISNNKKGITLRLPSGGIGFWVLPGLKIKACGDLDDSNSDKMLLKKLPKHQEESESEELFFEENESDGQGNSLMEDRRYSASLKKNRNRRKYRQSEEDENVRPYRRVEARMDLERLEKLIRKHEMSDEKKKSSSRVQTIYMDLEDGKRADDHDDIDEETSREIRRKLLEYKKRLREYDERRRRVESSEEMINSDKVIEAMKLISKMEKAIGKLSFYDRDGIPDGNDMNEFVKSTSRSKNSDNYDAFLDKLLSSKKIKRSSVPTKIEDQLQAIYKMLADEKERRRRSSAGGSKMEQELPRNGEVSLSRMRRDSDKKFGVDPLGLRKEGTFRRLSRFVEDNRERRSRRKDGQDRISMGSVMFDQNHRFADSEEDDFYGFSSEEPMTHFPQGDVHLEIGESTEKIPKPNDSPSKKKFKTIKNMKARLISDEMTTERNIDEKIHLSQAPAEYFENTNTLSSPRDYSPTDGYNELWEIESINQNIDDNSEMDESPTIRRIVEEQTRDVHEEKRAKELAVKRLIGYYEKPGASREEIAEHENMETGRKTNVKNVSTLPSEKNLSKRKRVKSLTSHENASQLDLSSTDFNVESVSSAEEQALGNYDLDQKSRDEDFRRRKRSIKNVLNDQLNKEMIFQDDKNLKDCNCRVPRTLKKTEIVGKKKKRVCPFKKLVKKKGKNKREDVTTQDANENQDSDAMKVEIEASKRLKRDVELFAENMSELTSEPQIINDERDQELPKEIEETQPAGSETTASVYDKNSADCNENGEDNKEQDLGRDFNLPSNQEEADLKGEKEKLTSSLNEGMTNSLNGTTLNATLPISENESEMKQERKMGNLHEMKNETLQENTTEMTVEEKKEDKYVSLQEKLTNETSETVSMEIKPEVSEIEKQSMDEKITNVTSEIDLTEVSTVASITDKKLLDEEMTNVTSETDGIQVSNVVKRENAKKIRQTAEAPSEIDKEIENSSEAASKATNGLANQLFRGRKNRKQVERTTKKSEAKFEKTERNGNTDLSNLEKAEESQNAANVFASSEITPKTHEEATSTVVSSAHGDESVTKIENENPSVEESNQNKVLKENKDKLTMRKSRFRAAKVTTELPITVTTADTTIQEIVTEIQNTNSDITEAPTLEETEEMTTRKSRLRTRISTELPSAVTPDSLDLETITPTSNTSNSDSTEESMLEEKEKTATRKIRLRASRVPTELPSDVITGPETITPTSDVISDITEEPILKEKEEHMAITKNGFQDNKMRSQLTSSVTSDTLVRESVTEATKNNSDAREIKTKDSTIQATTFHDAEENRVYQTTTKRSTILKKSESPKPKALSKSKKVNLKKLKLRKFAEPTTPPVLALRNEIAKKADKKSKQKEQLEKLEEKFRQKREQLITDYRDELLTDLEGASDETKNLYRREIIDLMMNDENLEDLVGEETFESMNKAPTCEDAKSKIVERTEEIMEKYVPEIIAIVGPVDEIIEEQIPQNQTAAKKSALEKANPDDLPDHKINRRHGNFWDSSESSNKFGIFSHEDESTDEKFPKKPFTTWQENLKDSFGSSEFGSEESDPIFKDKEPKASAKSEISVKVPKKFDAVTYPENSSEEITDVGSDGLLNLAKELDYYRWRNTKKPNTNNKSKQKGNNMKKSPLELDSKYANSKYSSLSLESDEKSSKELKAKPNTKNQWTPLVVNGVETLTDSLLKSIGVRTETGDEPWNVDKKPDEKSSKNIDNQSNSHKPKNVIKPDKIDMRDLLDPSKYKVMVFIPTNQNNKQMKSRKKRHLVSNDIMIDHTNSVMKNNNQQPKTNALDPDDKTMKKNEIYFSLFDTDVKPGQKKLSNDLNEKIYNDELKRRSFYDDELKNSFNENSIDEYSRLLPDVTLDKKLYDDESLPDLIEKAVPKLGDTMNSGIAKVRKMSESFEKYIDEFEEKFDQEKIKEEMESESSAQNVTDDSAPITNIIFSDAVTNVKKIFGFLSGLVHVIRRNIY